MLVPAGPEIERVATVDVSLARVEPTIEPFAISPPLARRLHTRYYDTLDLRLAAAGAGLWYGVGSGWTLRLPRTDGSAPDSTEHAMAGTSQTIPAAAVAAVAGIVRGKPLEAIADLRRLRVVREASLHDRVLAQIVQDDVRVGPPGEPRLRRVEIVLAPGAPAEVGESLWEGLRRYGIGPSAPVDDLRLALGERAVALDRPAIDAQATAGAVVRAALQANVDRLVATDPRLRLAMDPAGVHDARVAVRRLRADLRTFEPWLEAGWARALRARLRILADQLGAARDPDVLLEHVHDYARAIPAVDRTALEDALASLRARRDGAYRALAVFLREAAYLALLDSVAEAARAPALTARADRSARELVREVYAPVWKRLRKRVRRMPAASSDRSLHAMRIKAKNARYAAEAFEPVVGSTASRLAASMATLQTVLGEQHDAVTACGDLRVLAGGNRYAFVLGELAAVAYGRAVAQREAWRPVWKLVARHYERFVGEAP